MLLNCYVSRFRRHEEFVGEAVADERHVLLSEHPVVVDAHRLAHQVARDENAAVNCVIDLHGPLRVFIDRPRAQVRRLAPAPKHVRG